MTFEQFIRQLGIESGQEYSIKEVAAMLDMADSTVDCWCRYGLRSRKYGIVVLESFRKGTKRVVPGHCLVSFLSARNE